MICSREKFVSSDLQPIYKETEWITLQNWVLCKSSIELAFKRMKKAIIILQMLLVNFFLHFSLGFVELEALKERFVKHAFHAAKPKTEPRMVSVNIIRKEMMNDGKEELKADVVPVMLATEKIEDAARTKPGMLRRA